MSDESILKMMNLRIEKYTSFDVEWSKTKGSRKIGAKKTFRSLSGSFLSTQIKKGSKISRRTWYFYLYLVLRRLGSSCFDHPWGHWLVLHVQMAQPQKNQPGNQQLELRGVQSLGKASFWERLWGKVQRHKRLEDDLSKIVFLEQSRWQNLQKCQTMQITLELLLEPKP